MKYTEEPTEVHVEHYEERRPAQRGGPAGIDYFTVVYKRFTISGRVYERRATWRGPEPGFRHVVISSHQYPASKSPLNLPAKEMEDKPMKTWTEMTPADFGATTGTQMDLFAGIEGDGCGTISLDELAAEAEAAPAAEVERADGALFGLAATDEPVDGALFGLVAA